jgi:hypothetical protein
VAPQDFSVEPIEIDSIGSSLPLNGKTGRVAEGIIVKEREKRISNFHYVIHTLAFMIILPFLLMIPLGMPIPPEYSTIVSVVVGFYFGRALFNGA